MVVTHPFSSLSCWYNSNLLFTELTLPMNSWCFLELAAVMRFVHMVRSETGPEAAVRQSHRSCHQLVNYGISSYWSEHTQITINAFQGFLMY